MGIRTFSHIFMSFSSVHLVNNMKYVLMTLLFSHRTWDLHKFLFRVIQSVGDTHSNTFIGTLVSCCTLQTIPFIVQNSKIIPIFFPHLVFSNVIAQKIKIVYFLLASYIENQKPCVGFLENFILFIKFVGMTLGGKPCVFLI